jgi:hypothetical protein
MVVNASPGITAPSRRTVPIAALGVTTLMKSIEVPDVEGVTTR